MMFTKCDFIKQAAGFIKQTTPRVQYMYLTILLILNLLIMVTTPQLAALALEAEIFIYNTFSDEGRRRREGADGEVSPLLIPPRLLEGGFPIAAVCLPLFNNIIKIWLQFVFFCRFVFRCHPLSAV